MVGIINIECYLVAARKSSDIFILQYLHRKTGHH